MWWLKLTEEELAAIAEKEGEVKKEPEEEENPHDIIVAQMFKVYSLCKEFQCLPNAGGLDDQNPFWIDCMDIISTEIKSYEKEENDKLRQK